MEFKTLVIVKCPVEVAWERMLNQMPGIGDRVEDIESITETGRRQLQGELLSVTHIWKVRPPLPDFIAKYIQPDMLAWTDTAIWKPAEKAAEWEIQSHYFKTNLDCQGRTTFEPALGGKGCRLTFSGSLHWKGEGLPFSLGIMEKPVSKAIESVLSNMVPASFRKIAEALEKMNP